MMPISGSEFSAITAILIMTAATYVTRIAGFWLMGHVTVTPRVQRMLDALPGSVVAAIAAPMVFKNGAPAGIAIFAVLAFMLLWRNEFIAVLVGIIVVALLRAAGL